MFRTDKPTEDANRYIAWLEQQPVEFDHGCTACEAGFNKGGGVKISDEKFCNACLKSFQHYRYYQACGLSDRAIWKLTEKETRKL